MSDTRKPDTRRAIKAARRLKRRAWHVGPIPLAVRVAFRRAHA